MEPGATRTLKKSASSIKSSLRSWGVTVKTYQLFPQPGLYSSSPCWWSGLFCPGSRPRTVCPNDPGGSGPAQTRVFLRRQRTFTTRRLERIFAAAAPAESPKQGNLLIPGPTCPTLHALALHCHISNLLLNCQRAQTAFYLTITITYIDLDVKNYIFVNDFSMLLCRQN